jgi:Icc protein
MLTKLDEELGMARQRHALVCLHHHPVAMHSRWLDSVGLANANEFWSVIDSHPQVRR